mgnify:CR=1 FL=1
MPLPANRAQVCFSLSLDPDDHGRFQGITLSAIASLASTHPLLLFAGGLFHREGHLMAVSALPGNLKPCRRSKPRCRIHGQANEPFRSEPWIGRSRARSPLAVARRGVAHVPIRSPSMANRDRPPARRRTRSSPVPRAIESILSSRWTGLSVRPSR